jgi:hypothetical protein
MNPQVAAMPPVRIVFGRDWTRMGRHYAFGVLWDRKPWPRLGELIYRKQFVLRVYFDIGRYP